MPDLEIAIGGRSFTVSCQPGEEHFLRGAAAMLDAEAAPLVAQMGRLPETRILLMAGLMLADKAAAVEDENRQLKLKLAEIESRPQPEREKLEVAVVPPGLRETLEEIAARAEAMAASVEERLQ
ncbi:cell division protein ZapA [Cypionkella aquatica]|uniref:Cell division protein ZapA n=1 Tax=Cypionkella aquatica TaxID=1756042 RepID=A0AA37TY92_9RHOB|nr:cell division protein ZapA [Cypionkella aquatica]GLS87780.1 cell division protein ZapA [Cypionkella aquatica]